LTGKNIYEKRLLDLISISTKVSIKCLTMTDKKGRETIPPYQENDYIKKNCH
jgi:hypothetical protein